MVPRVMVAQMVSDTEISNFLGDISNQIFFLVHRWHIHSFESSKKLKNISILTENEPEIEIFQKMSEIAFGHEEFI